MDKFRNWLMHLIAGRTNAYWISDRALAVINNVRSVPGEVGAILLVRAMEQTGATSATITLDGYTVRVDARPAYRPAASRDASP